MRQFLPIRYLLPLTHLSVFIFTALFTGFSTYSITRDYLENKKSPGPLSQISEKVNAQENQEFVVYEKHEIIGERSNNRHRERITGYARSFTGDEHIIYSFIDDPLDRKFQKTVPMATLLSNGKIFLNGVSDRGYVILDLMGNNVTSDYPILKNRDFPLGNTLFINEKELFYTYSGVNAVEKNIPHRIYRKREGNPHLEVMESSSFPTDEFWLKPLGWGSHPNEFYVSRQSDTATYARLWRVNTQDQSINTINSVTGALTESVQVCPEQGYAVFIAAPLDPSQGNGMKPVAPSRLIFSNLKTDTSRTLFTSPYVLTDLKVSCRSQHIFVKEQNRSILLDLNGKLLPHIPVSEKPLLFWDNDHMVILDRENEISFLHLRRGNRAMLGEKTGEDNSSKIRYTLLGLGRPS